MVQDKIEVSLEIEASAARMWEILTKPEYVKEAFWGTTLTTSWKVGESITYSGEWEGKPYQDKGTILAFEPNSYIKMSYWSTFSGTPDIPENYAIIEYTVKETPKGVLLTISQENFNTEEQRDHSAKNWLLVMETMKKLAETRD